ncbi:hypothetical protein rosag_20780 [Roseisolibacter agri]|uniref:Uncharacterized protein n=1 Tax=Roseisolibacter agri TaxID=2014610 RepID=A0AA37Q2V3_9BACT|nr:hypothetical protein rosag_20780 [Roseisolibacter agri]
MYPPPRVTVTAAVPLWPATTVTAGVATDTPIVGVGSTVPPPSSLLQAAAESARASPTPSRPQRANGERVYVTKTSRI